MALASQLELQQGRRRKAAGRKNGDGEWSRAPIECLKQSSSLGPPVAPGCCLSQLGIKPLPSEMQA